MFQTVLSSAARLGKITLIGAACLSLAACPRDQLDNILVNETDAAIEVMVRLRHPDVRANPPDVCGLQAGAGRISSDAKAWTRDGGTHRPLHWDALADEVVDAQACTMIAIVPPGHGMRVATDSLCAGDAADAQARPADVPVIWPDVIALRVTSRGQERVFQDWQVAEQFIREPSGHCLYYVR